MELFLKILTVTIGLCTVNVLSEWLTSKDRLQQSNV